MFLRIRLRTHLRELRRPGDDVLDLLVDGLERGLVAGACGQHLRPQPLDLGRCDGLSPQEYRFFLDMQFALHGTLGKDVMGPWCVPAKALYSLPMPAHAGQCGLRAGLMAAQDFTGGSEALERRYGYARAR